MELHGESVRSTELVRVAVTWYGTGDMPPPRVDIGPDGAVVEVSVVRHAEAAR
jgi:hypothetical protein